MEPLDFGFLVLAGWAVQVRDRPVPLPGAERPPSQVPSTVATLRSHWPAARGQSWNDIFRAASLLDRLSEAAALPGDVVECGVWRGGTALLLAASLEALAPSKRLYLCDSFQGLPALTDGDRPEWYREGRFAARRDEVAELLARHHLADRCTILEGWFADTLPSLSGIRACMVHIDCDLYQSTVDCLTHLYPAVADGGVIVFDDYSDGSGGERKAANAHAAATGEVLHIGPYSQAYLYKGETIANTRARELLEAPSEDHRVLRSLSSLQDNAAYGEHVTNVLDRLREITRDFATFERLCRGSAASSPRPGAD